LMPLTILVIWSGAIGPESTRAGFRSGGEERE
jgi:hypothetical protein